MNKNPIEMAAGILVIIGGLNWGLVGLVNMDLIEKIFGTIPPVPQIIYILVGLSALYMIYAMYMAKK